MISLTTLVYYVVKLVITLINLTCKIETKIHLVGITLRFDDSVRVISSFLANKKRPESLSWNKELDWEQNRSYPCLTLIVNRSL